MLREVKVASPFVLRSVDPPISAAGHTVSGIERLGKRVVIGLDGDLWIVIHLMIAGRFRWLAPAEAARQARPCRVRLRRGHALADRSGTKRRASCT